MIQTAMRNPLATYEQAVWRLVQMEAAGSTADKLELAVQIVADVFWLSDEKVVHDMKKASRNLGAMPAARPRRRYSPLIHGGLDA